SSWYVEAPENALRGYQKKRGDQKKKEDTRLPPNEDVPLIGAYDAVSEALQKVIHDHWTSIRTSTSVGPIQSRYNFRLTDQDTGVLDTRLWLMFEEQTRAFKANLSFGFILRHKEPDRYRYFHSSCNAAVVSSRLPL
ncbi:MAG: hypothetical protein M3H12_01180, partial [Chromatiales bacterium]